MTRGPKRRGVSARTAKPQGPKRPARSTADEGLVPDQFPDLNRQFYEADLAPHHYIDLRLKGLFLAAQSVETFPDTYDVDVKVGDVTARWSAEDGDAKRAIDYYSTESTVLLHHAAEALLRMYFAHADSPDCPWMEIARLRTPGEFKQRLEAFGSEIADEGTSASIMLVFTGHAKPNDTNERLWSEVRDALGLLLSHLQGVLLSEADVYNAAKHGLAVRPGEEGISFSISTPQVPLDTTGPAIAYLAALEGDERWRWHRVTHWTNPDQNIGLLYLIRSLMQNIWAVARYRYLGGEFDTASLYLPTSKLIRELLEFNAGNPIEGGGRLHIPSMSMTLLYFADPQEGERDAAVKDRPGG